MVAKMICDLLWNWCNYLAPSLIFAIVATSLLWCFFRYGWKDILKQVLNTIRTERRWQYRFVFLMYSYFILDRTLLSRHFEWTNGLKHVLGGWSLYDPETGAFTLEAVENFMFFVPFMALYFASFSKGLKFISCIKRSILIGFGLSLCIEMNQLFFKVGEFQIADLVYNTAGAVLGGLIYWISHKISRK